jgi:hypothetical protein
VAAVLSSIWTAVAACVGSVTAFYRQKPAFMRQTGFVNFWKGHRRSNVCAIMEVDIHGENS